MIYRARKLPRKIAAIKIKPETGYGEETETLIKSRIKNEFDPNVHISFEKVGSIPREASGKMRLIVGMKADEKT